MKTNIKIMIGIAGTLAVGFIGFQVLKVEPPEVEVVYNVSLIKVYRLQSQG